MGRCRVVQEGSSLVVNVVREFGCRVLRWAESLVVRELPFFLKLFQGLVVKT